MTAVDSRVSLRGTLLVFKLTFLREKDLVKGTPRRYIPTPATRRRPSVFPSSVLYLPFGPQRRGGCRCDVPLTREVRECVYSIVSRPRGTTTRRFRVGVSSGVDRQGVLTRLCVTHYPVCPTLHSVPARVESLSIVSCKRVGAQFRVGRRRRRGRR